MARKSRKNIDAAAAPVPTAAKTWNVGAYVRLSAIDRKQKGNSIENQQAIIGAYIAERSDMVLREVYIDNGTTGQTFERAGFQRMLADLENGKIDCCISKDLSRLGRNSIDTGYYIEKYFPTRGFRYIAINDNYDSADGHSGGIMVSLKNLINETYAIEVGRKVHNTFQMNVRSGKFVGQFAPYGYADVIIGINPRSLENTGFRRFNPNSSCSVSGQIFKDRRANKPRRSVTLRSLP